MDNNTENITQESQPNVPKGDDNKTGIIIIIALIAAVIIGVIIWFAVSGGGNKSDNRPTAEQMGEQVELSSLNLNGIWSMTQNGADFELNFKSDKTLSFKQMDAEGNVTAASDSGTYEVNHENGLLYLTIESGGQTFADECNAMVSNTKLYIVATENGTGLFNGFYSRVTEDMPTGDNSSESTKDNESKADTPNASASETSSTPETTVATPPTTTQTDKPVTTQTDKPATQTKPETSKKPTEEKPKPSEELEIPSSITEYFSLTCEELFNNNVPYDEHASEYGFAIYSPNKDVHLYYNYSNGYGTGDLVYLNCTTQMISPNISSNRELLDAIITLDHENCYIKWSYDGGMMRIIVYWQYGECLVTFESWPNFNRADAFDDTNNLVVVKNEYPEDAVDVAKYTIDAKGGLNMRNGPSTECDVVLLIPENSNVYGLGHSEDGWEFVCYEHDSQTTYGFVSSQYLKNA